MPSPCRLRHRPRANLIPQGEARGACPPPSSMRWRRRRGHDRILILHDQPPPSTMDQDKCAYVRFVLMLDAVGTRESANPAGNGCNGNLFACEADIGLLDIVRHAIVRKSGVSGKSVSARVDLGGRRYI